MEKLCGPEFNVFGGDDGAREGSLVPSEIEFPSHVSELGSFHSDFDVTVNSNDNISLDDQKINYEFQDHNIRADVSTGSSLELPEQAEENVEVFLAALKAATISDNVEEATDLSQKSYVSSDQSNVDSSRFISRESFPESILGQSLSVTQSYSQGDIENQPSSTPLSNDDENKNNEQKAHDSRLSEKFLIPSRTPENTSNIENLTNASNPWSFSGTSMLLQTPVPTKVESDNKEERLSTPLTLKKQDFHQTSFTSPLQKKLWADSLSISNKTFDVKQVNSPKFPKKEYNPFDDSVTSWSANDPLVKNKGNPFESVDKISFGQEFEEKFSFQSAGDALEQFDKDEEEFQSTKTFDNEIPFVGDNTLFGDCILPGSNSKTGRQSVIGVNDPDNKGEVRISFGKFFAARTEELGTLGDDTKNRPRPHFDNNITLNKSPEAGPPRPLYRPPSSEDDEDDGMSIEHDTLGLGSLSKDNTNAIGSLTNVGDTTINSAYLGPNDASNATPTCSRDEDSMLEKKSLINDVPQVNETTSGNREATSTIVSGVKNIENTGRVVDGNKDRSQMTPENGNEFQKKAKSSAKTRRISNIDPDASTLAALKYCQSSEGLKVLRMSPSELKLLSNTLAKVTHGESKLIFDVLIDFINRRKSISNGKNNDDLSDVFLDKTRTDASKEDETDGFTFYHSDTSCEVSPNGSKFEPLSSVQSPPLDTSSPKSTGSSIVQSDSRDSGFQHELSTPTSVVKTTTSPHCSPSPVYTNSSLTQSYPGNVVSCIPNNGFRNTPTVPCFSDNKNTLRTNSVSLSKECVTSEHLAATRLLSGSTATYKSPLPTTMGNTAAIYPSSASHVNYPAPLLSGNHPSDYPMALTTTAYLQSIQQTQSTCGRRPVYQNTSPVCLPSIHGTVDMRSCGYPFPQTIQPDLPVSRTGSISDARTWTNVNPIPHHPDSGWNWRTDQTSQIQMVMPPSLDFPGVLCVGLSSEAFLPIHNPTTRWIRCSCVVIRCTLNGVEVDPEHDSPFVIREAILIGPKLTENVKIEFRCVIAGIYTAEMKVVSIPVGSVGCDNETSSAVVTIQGFSEHPNLEIVTEVDAEGQLLDFGEIHEGHNVIRALKVLNRGRTAIPLKMLICSSSSPEKFIFSKKNTSHDAKKVEMKNTILKCVLSPITTGTNPEFFTIWVELVGKNCHNFEQTQQAEILSALVNIQLDSGNVAKTLGNVALKGVIGVTNIQIPKAFQMAMCLSSSVGQKVSRQLPFSNGGNINANVELTIPKYPDMFHIIPDKFTIKPGTTITAEVGFCPTAKGSHETVIQISERDYNKSYEVLLRGSCVEPKTTKDEGAPSLLSNKSWLSWTGIDVGKAIHKRLFLLNDSSEHPLQFKAMILGEHADFEIQRVKTNFTKGGNSSEQITLRPKEKIPIYVLFAPSSFGIFKSALVLNQISGPRFKVPLYGYGGTSKICIFETNVIKKTNDGLYTACLGQVSLGHRNIVKLVLKNTGSRAAFIKTLCFSDHQIRLHYPKSHLSIVPSEFVLPERSSKELVIVYQPLQHDAKDCQTITKKVATVVFHYGDEVLRQWYKRNLSKQDFDGRATSENMRFEDVGFNKTFQDENNVFEDFDFPNLNDYEEIFDNHISQVFLNLIGGPEKNIEAEATVKPAAITPERTTDKRPMIRCQTPAQKEGAEDNNEVSTWSIIPEQLSLKVPVKGSTDSTKKVQLLNYTDRPLEFEFSWPAHCIAVTPHFGTILPKNQLLIHIGVWSSITSAGVDLPWSGSAYVTCDGTRKSLAIQIHNHLVNEDSPVPTMINKRMIKADLTRDDSLLQRISSKPSKPNNPLVVTPKIISFQKTEIGKSSICVVKVKNISSTSVRWQLSSVAPAYAKVSETSSELLRATYSVFRFSSQTGLIRAGETISIEAEFRTRDVGVYCQIWDLQTNPESPLTSTKTQLELSGEAILCESAKEIGSERKQSVRLSEPVRVRPVVTSTNKSEKRETNKLTATSGSVYLESSDIQFPDTEVGKTSLSKIKLCNKSSVEQKFKIIAPDEPFKFKRANDMSIKPGHFLKMPLYFSPKQRSKQYTSIVKFKNLSGAETLCVKVTGNSCT